ncbi:MAG: septum formation protein Maf [Clostridia bacterium]|nr:septum formation protein Maf [Clostridia bacterium]
MKIILASKSPRRRKMFDELKIEHILWDGEVDENSLKDKIKKFPPSKQVELLAKAKAEGCFEDIKDSDALIIAADTVVALKNNILGKPIDDDDARNMLRSMSDTSHYVYSGVCAVYNGKTVSSSEKTKIKFRKITDQEIKRYIETGEHKDKAGSYGIQEKGGYFVESVNGDINNVVGLPILKLRNMILDEFKIDLFNLD